jgi:hypothetical protein
LSSDAAFPGAAKQNVFLSRFTFAIQDHEIELKAKTLGE